MLKYHGPLYFNNLDQCTDMFSIASHLASAGPVCKFYVVNESTACINCNVTFCPGRAACRGTFTISGGTTGIAGPGYQADSYLRVDGFVRGVAWVNGHNLGRCSRAQHICCLA